MKINEDESEIIFKSGRVEYANCGIIGIGPDGRVYGGYDDPMGREFTADDRNELADHMISMWQAFKEAKNET